ncbi:hypothetical protein [Gymnodinialimonas sp.]
MRQFKLLTISTAFAAVVATGAMAGGSSVDTGPTIPPQGTTATTTGSGVVSTLRNAYSNPGRARRCILGCAATGAGTDE